MSVLEITTPKELRSLLNLAPVMISWMQDINPTTAADVFFSVNKPLLRKQDLIVNFAFQELLKARKRSHLGITTKELKAVFSSYEVQIWSQCLWRLFTAAQPKLIPEALELALLEAARASKLKSETELADKLETLLLRMSYNSFFALAELCGLIRDASLEPEKLASELGPSILLCSNDNPKHYRLASYLFLVMVKHSSRLFGISREKSHRVFGFRAPGLGILAPSSDAHKVLRKQHLKTFYAIRDKKYLPIVDSLFELHGFGDIAHGIYKKYAMLPEGWRADLSDMKHKRNVKLDWYNEKDILFLTEEPIKMPGVAKLPRYLPVDNSEKAEAIVDEIINNEQDYYRKLHSFVRYYVSEVQTISRGDVTPEAKEALGLSQKQVDEVFGADLRRCLALSEKLLVKFEVLTLVRTPIVTTNMGRPGIVADIFLTTSADFVAALAPYNKHHARNTAIMNQAEEGLRKLVRRHGTDATNGMVFPELSYMELWAEIRHSQDVFKKQEMDAFLIEPVRRCPSYIMLLSRLIKQVGEKHPAFNKLVKAQQMVKEATQGINREIKNHEIVRNLFGF